MVLLLKNGSKFVGLVLFGLFVFSLLDVVVINSQNTKKISSTPFGWVRYPKPLPESPIMRCANYSQNDWRVINEAGNIDIRLDTEFDRINPLPPQINSNAVAVSNVRERYVLKVEDGWLVGLNGGEFGGGLWWFSTDANDTLKLSDDRILGLSKCAKGVLALSGISHMGREAGKVILITGMGRSQKVSLLADLHIMPRAFTVESPDSWLIITSSKLLRLKTTGEVKALFTTDYRLLYPNSMALLSSGVLYVGMRHFITSLTPSETGYREDWFVPKDCTKFKLQNTSCICETPQK